jgi:predicted patatin/cPLA2 family phospholipase
MIVRPVFRTANAITFYVDGGVPDTIPVQIVLTLYEPSVCSTALIWTVPSAYYEGSHQCSPSWIMSVTTPHRSLGTMDHVQHGEDHQYSVRLSSVRCPAQTAPACIAA